MDVQTDYEAGEGCDDEWGTGELMKHRVGGRRGSARAQAGRQRWHMASRESGERVV